jgi:5-methylthioribose kinase
MVRRIVGLAHVADIDTIPDARVRHVAQRTALAIGTGLIKNHRSAESIGELIDIAETAAAQG